MPFSLVFAYGSEGQDDLIMSLCHVINHINNLPDLEAGYVVTHSSRRPLTGGRGASAISAKRTSALSARDRETSRG